MQILKYITRIAACGLVLAFCSCKKEAALTPTEDNRLYKLPQGNQPYDQEIVDFYEEYRTVILYKFSNLDFLYSPNGNNPAYTSFTPAEGNQVQECLDFLHEQWFDFYDAGFLKKTLPFKILLAADLKRDVPPYTGLPIGITYPRAIKGYNHVTFGRAGRISSMTAAETDTVRGELQRAYWHLATLNRMIELPPAFTALMPDYTSVHAWYPERSGVFTLYNGMTHFDDIADYIYKITSTDYATLMSTLFIPSRDPNGMFRKKYDAIVQYYLQKYNVDLQAIGNM
jgi:hypothetical protein